MDFLEVGDFVRVGGTCSCPWMGVGQTDVEGSVDLLGAGGSVRGR
ncbi:hypothetical protein [Ancylothrix sp. D3o]|nr:hypothetical protein [Ancylothrix sp. D3o]